MEAFTYSYPVKVYFGEKAAASGYESACEEEDFAEERVMAADIKKPMFMRAPSAGGTP